MSVRVPVPCLTRPPLPVITLASVVLLALLVVRVPAPNAIAPPAPDRAPTVWYVAAEVEHAVVDRERCP